MSIGENIRKVKEVSRLQAANALYMTLQMLCAIENGIKQPSLNVAIVLDDYFGTTVEILQE